MGSSKVRMITVLTAAGAVLVAQTALADQGQRGGWDQRPGADSDFARVIDVEPMKRRIRVTEPRRECFEETRYDNAGYDDRRGSYYRDSSRPAAGQMILGGLLGAAIGNQFGRGDGRRAATVAGALIGTAIGHDASHAPGQADRYGYGGDSRRYSDSRPYTVQRCDVRYDERWEERIEGYHVTYEYNGRRFETNLPYDPGPQLRVRVNVRPDEG
jgi:uncharacterized protein YcfJ